MASSESAFASVLEMNTLSCQMTGVAAPGPGRSADQTTFSVGLNFVREVDFGRRTVERRATPLRPVLSGCDGCGRQDQADCECGFHRMASLDRVNEFGVSVAGHPYRGNVLVNSLPPPKRRVK
jgi:hypothetical protein